MEAVLLQSWEKAVLPVRHHNNFDLIRLAAALSVVLLHWVGFAKVPTTSPLGILVLTIAQLLPGVPIFFVISGFLITQTLLNNPDLKGYAKSRFARIYPAFVVSTLITSLILWWFGYFNFTWFINQFPIIGLAGTPQVTVPFSGGMPNMSLWTIPVEVGFYILLPLLLRVGLSKRQFACIVVGLMIFSAVLQGFDDFGMHHNPDWRKGIFHHFLFFGCGILARLYWERLQPYLCLPFWALAHGILSLILLACIKPPLLLGVVSISTVSPLNLLLVFTLPGLVLSSAVTMPSLAGRLLKGNDWSYGIYLYHAPYFLMLRHLGVAAIPTALLGTAMALITAWLSWRCIEYPALAWARRYNKRGYRKESQPSVL